MKRFLYSLLGLIMGLVVGYVINSISVFWFFTDWTTGLTPTGLYLSYFVYAASGLLGIFVGYKMGSEKRKIC